MFCVTARRLNFDTDPFQTAAINRPLTTGVDFISTGERKNNYQAIAWRTRSQLELLRGVPNRPVVITDLAA